MPEKIEKVVRFSGVLLALAVGLASLIQAYAVLPYRVEQNEKAIQHLQADNRASLLALARIDERLMAIQDILEKGNH